MSSLKVKLRNLDDEVLNSLSGGGNLKAHFFYLEAETDGQTEFEIPMETFDAENDTVLVIDGIGILIPEVGYTISGKTVKMVDAWEIGDSGGIFVFKNVPRVSEETTISGTMIADGSISIEKLGANVVEELDEIKKSVSDGKAMVAGAITEKGVETATDASFEVMVENIAEIESLSSFTLKDEVSEYLYNTTENSTTTVKKGRNYVNGIFTIPDGYNFITKVVVNVTIDVNGYFTLSATGTALQCTGLVEFIENTTETVNYYSANDYVLLQVTRSNKGKTVSFTIDNLSTNDYAFYGKPSSITVYYR